MAPGSHSHSGGGSHSHSSGGESYTGRHSAKEHGNGESSSGKHSKGEDDEGGSGRHHNSSTPSNVSEGQAQVATTAQQGRPGGGDDTSTKPPKSTEDASTDTADHRDPSSIPDSELAYDAIHGDVSTESGHAVFWSGRTHVGPGADDFVSAGPQNAMDIAHNRGMTTLEGLIAERGINMPEWGDGSDPVVVQSWTRISERYAQGVSGDVHVVLGEQVRPGAVWETEFAALQKNPKVTSITKIDLTTGKEEVLWTRSP